jgi:hypothetical protein
VSKLSLSASPLANSAFVARLSKITIDNLRCW